MRGRLSRYALWQLRDYVFERGIPLLLVNALMFFPVVAALRGLKRLAPDAASFPDAALAGFIGLLPTLAFVSVLLSVNGIISYDRKRGFYRFLFAKPVSVTRFYAQSFAFNWIGCVLIMSAVVLAFTALVYPISLAGFLTFVSLWYLSLGGVTFLFSAITRFDWVALGATFFAAQVLRLLYPAERSWYGRALDIALPPFHRIGETGAALVRGTDVSSATLLWIAGYGVAAFVLGLLVLRRRPLAS